MCIKEWLPKNWIILLTFGSPYISQINPDFLIKHWVDWPQKCCNTTLFLIIQHMAFSLQRFIITRVFTFSLLTRPEVEIWFLISLFKSLNLILVVKKVSFFACSKICTKGKKYHFLLAVKLVPKKAQILWDDEFTL